MSGHTSHENRRKYTFNKYNQTDRSVWKMVTSILEVFVYINNSVTIKIVLTSFVPHWWSLWQFSLIVKRNNDDFIVMRLLSWGNKAKVLEISFYEFWLSVCIVDMMRMPWLHPPLCQDVINAQDKIN